MQPRLARQSEATPPGSADIGERPSPYIPRSLFKEGGTSGRGLIAEADIAALDGNIVILGDPGMGKTRLTQSLQKQLDAVRVTAGTFQRDESGSRYAPARDGRVIIDGLDEIAAATGASAIDAVLKKLSRIGYPRFILSCRAADWQGSTDRHRIVQDYGTPLYTLHLQPFSDAQALEFLAAHDPRIDARAALEELERRDLTALYRNPLTLQLTAELIEEGQGLPQSRADLFERACVLLVREENAAHQRSEHAMCPTEDLLTSAGAIFAHLILSGLQGVADRPFTDTPESFVHHSRLAGIPDAPLLAPALKTRLFQSMAEGLFIPFHRMIAEFLGARWLAIRIARGLSKRRLHQAFVTARGVPTTLRGLHAWLACFSPELAAECFRADPYGILRYGEPSRLSLPHARLLLSSLASLAEEDPYFRSYDWSSRTVGGLTRPELKDSIVQLLRNSSRHVDLSRTVLESIAGSPLANELKPELLQIVGDETAAHEERVSAARALIDSRVDVAWPVLVDGLCAKGTRRNCTIALEIMQHAKSTGFTGPQIAKAFIAYAQACRAEENNRALASYHYAIFEEPAQWLSASQCAEVLDALADRMASISRRDYWTLVVTMADLIYDLIVPALQVHPPAARFWRWVSLLKCKEASSATPAGGISAYLSRNETLRRETQKLALADFAASGKTVIVHLLMDEYEYLALRPEDALALLQEIAAKDALARYDRELWISLVLHLRSERKLDDELQALARQAIEKHACLAGEWYDFEMPEPGPCAVLEEERAALMEVRESIVSGENLQALHRIAEVYLGTYDRLDKRSPLVRVRDRWGDEILELAHSGFAAVLKRSDLPSARQIVEQHLADERSPREALILIAAITDLSLQDRPVSSVPAKNVLAGAAAWWVSRHFGFVFPEQPFWFYVSPVIVSARDVTTSFLTDVLRPCLIEDSAHIPSLRYFHSDAQLMAAGAPLVPGWLAEFPDLRSATQLHLLALAMQFSDREQFRSLVRERLAALKSLRPHGRRNWIAAAFLMDFAQYMPRLLEWCESDREIIWPLKEIAPREGWHDTRRSSLLSLPQLAFIVRVFGPQWPCSPSEGDFNDETHPSQATSFIESCIRDIGADCSDEAAEILQSLVEDAALHSYGKHLRHVKAQQLRTRRDSEYAPPPFEDLKQTLAGGLPGSIDDLKALLLDSLIGLEEYIRHSDTRSWESFWDKDRPKPENTCRDRLIDLLRPRMAPEIMILPETAMPEMRRADFVATCRQMGLPVEIKGQWHAEVWNATVTQLIDRYAHDWRASGRGVYLVLWFGKVPGLNLPRPPDGSARPRTPSALREMLIDRLPCEARSRIDVIVLDLSKPQSS